MGQLAFWLRKNFALHLPHVEWLNLLMSILYCFVHIITSAVFFWQEYSKNPSQNWKNKDAAIFLVTSLAAKAQTQKVCLCLCCGCSRFQGRKVVCWYSLLTLVCLCQFCKVLVLSLPVSFVCFYSFTTDCLSLCSPMSFMCTPRAKFFKLSKTFFQRFSYVRWFRNSEEVFF